MAHRVFAFTDKGVLLEPGTPPSPLTDDARARRTLTLETRPLPGGDGDSFAWVGDRAVDGLTPVGMRTLFGVWDDALLERAFLASQLAHFDATTRFCGRCGTPTEWTSGREPAVHVKRCPTCEREFYPAIAPCAIVCVTDGDRILLARKSMFPGGFYGLVAGFLEPAETLERCAEREVLEETGVRIRDVRYFGSQPWPFPSQLMVGFNATYDGGEIVVDTTELEEARWFHRDALPKLPPPQSIARRLIEAWRAKPTA